MWDHTEETSNTAVSVCTHHDFEAFEPYIGMLYRVAMRFTRDTREAQALVEKALMTAAMRSHDASASSWPKMALLSALREAYIEFLKFRNPVG